MARDYSLGSALPTAQQRRPEYLRDDDWIRDLLHRGHVAHIASVWDDQPFVIASTYYFDEPRHRLIFHSNLAGRLRANVERNPRVCLEVSEMGRLLASNVALEFSLQYRSVMAFGSVRLVEDPIEKRVVLHQLIAKYFEALKVDEDYRGATDSELKRTTVYAMTIESWSGKENWKDRAAQSNEWPALDGGRLTQGAETAAPPYQSP